MKLFRPQISIFALLMAALALAFSGNLPLQAADSSASKYESVDQIKGLGIFKFGSHFKDFPPGLLRIIDPRAKGILLRVSPYGDNYLVTDLKGLTWGNIPLTGIVVTFHDDVLIDVQASMKAKKIDFYFADRAFKEKYGQSEEASLPVETWHGAETDVTLIFIGADFSDMGSLDKPAAGKIEFFDHAQWAKFEAARKAKMKADLDKRYQDAGKKVKANL